MPAAGRGAGQPLRLTVLLDTSGSMDAPDFSIGALPVSRLEVAKGVMADFVEDRPYDRLGLVVFGADWFVMVPLLVLLPELTGSGVWGALVLAAVVLGGAAVTGGRGSVLGTMLGVLLITVGVVLDVLRTLGEEDSR